MKIGVKTFHIITLFPNAFDSYLAESIVARAIREKKISVKFYNPRDYTKDKWARVDRRPYGGGPGMVLEAPSFVKAIEAAIKSSRTKCKVFIFSAQGKQFTNQAARKLSTQKEDLVLVCGRYEGIDARVKKFFSSKGGSASGGKAAEISIGPYVLTGGELPAMVLIDAISRQIDGVLGNDMSLEEKRSASSEVYTRPEVFKYKGKKLAVPKVLLTGNHAKIEDWRKGKLKFKP